jgi:hypothetical protein
LSLAEVPLKAALCLLTLTSKAEFKPRNTFLERILLNEFQRDDGGHYFGETRDLFLLALPLANANVVEFVVQAIMTGAYRWACC